MAAHDLGPPILLRPAEAAALLGVSRAKLYRLLASGALGNVTVRIGGSTRISRAALERWIERQLAERDDEGDEEVPS